MTEHCNVAMYKERSVGKSEVNMMCISQADKAICLSCHLKTKGTPAGQNGLRVLRAPKFR